MKYLTESEAKQSFMGILGTIQQEPVTITKDNKEVAIMLEATRYHELKRLEDILYGKAAELAITEGFTPQAEADQLLNKLRNSEQFN